MAEESLFVATAAWAGSPANKYQGSGIKPPLPPIASTKPARKTIGQAIKTIFRLSSITVTKFITISDY